MFIAYRNAASRQKIVPYFSAPKNITLENADEDRIINCLIEATSSSEPHDLAVIFFIRDITEKRRGYIDRLLKAGIPVSIFAPTPMQLSLTQNQLLLDMIIISEASFAQFNDGPLALYSMNDDIQIIYPEDNMLSQLNASARNAMLFGLIEPLFHAAGVDFPLDDPTFRMLRHSAHYEKTCQWEKILYLGNLALQRYPAYNAMLYISMSIAAIRLKKYQIALCHAYNAQKMSFEFGHGETECYAAYLMLLTTWVSGKPDVFINAEKILIRYENYELENELLHARIVSLMLLSCFLHPSGPRRFSEEKLLSLKEQTCKTLAEHGMSAEYDELSAAYKDYLKDLTPRSHQLTANRFS